MTNESRRLRAIPLPLSLATFLTLAYLACLALALVVPDRGLHTPFLQFYAGFAWTWSGMLIGLVESFAYGFVSRLVFAPIYNLYND